MEGWNNEEVLTWVTSKGYGACVPCLKDDKLTGEAFLLLTLEDMLKYKVEKHAARRIILKRDKYINGDNGSRSRLKRITSHLSLRRDKSAAMKEDGGTSSPRLARHVVTAGGQPSFPLPINITDNNGNNNNTINSSTESIPEVVVHSPDGVPMVLVKTLPLPTANNKHTDNSPCASPLPSPSTSPRKEAKKKSEKRTLTIHHGHSNSSSSYILVPHRKTNSTKRSKSPKRRGSEADIDSGIQVP